MNPTTRPLAALLLAALLPGVGLAADPYVYPAKGQSKQQQEKDTYECYGWAKQQSGFDPMQAPKQAYAQPQATEGGLFRGAARGAAVGAVGGAIGGDAGKGAAIGAMAGGVIGGARRRHQANEISAEQQQAKANYQAQRSNYDRAYSACLRGRGYTVN